MEYPNPQPPRPKQNTTNPMGLAHHPQHHLLRAQNSLPMALPAKTLPTLEHGLSLLSDLGSGWSLGVFEYRSQTIAASKSEQTRSTHSLLH
jgi:hypothetical protein